MNGKRFRIRIVSLWVVVLLSLVLFLGSQAVSAAPTRWARWWIETSFANNVMDTELVIQLGYTTQSGQNIISQQQSFSVNCTAVGTPVIQNGTAIFDGSSYFSCAVPNIKDKVLMMSNGALLIPDSCSAKRPYVKGVLSLDGTPLNPGGDNPLFYRDDIQFSVPLHVGTQQAKIMTVFAQAGAMSSKFAINPAAQTAAVEYVKTGPNTYAPAFTVDSTSLTSTPTTLNGPFMLSNLDRTVYIGYSLLTNNYFEGTLTSLLVDPVCVGQG